LLKNPKNSHTSNFFRFAFAINIKKAIPDCLFKKNYQMDTYKV